jgi:antitoxin component YwqK of YwqJK toxin-antitoxin module
MWTPISEGDTLQEVAFRGDELFTGACIDLDTAGVLIGRYTFRDGLLQKLEEFHENGQVYKILNYSDGIPNGPGIRITDKGVLDSFFFFDKGVRSGAYYLTRDRTDWGLPPCIEYGVYNNGESAQLTKPCFERK